MFALFSHVGIVVRDLDAAIARWAGVFGLEVVDRFEVPEEGARSVVLSTGGAYGEATCVELVAPVDNTRPGSTIAKRLADHGEGVFHLAFRVSDADRAAATLTDAGAQCAVLPPAGPETTSRAVVHPRSANGVLIELLGGPPPARTSPRNGA